MNIIIGETHVFSLCHATGSTIVKPARNYFDWLSGQQRAPRAPGVTSGRWGRKWWTKEEVAELRKLHAAGFTHQQIGNTLGRSATGVENKLHKLRRIDQRMARR